MFNRMTVCLFSLSGLSVLRYDSQFNIPIEQANQPVFLALCFAHRLPLRLLFPLLGTRLGVHQPIRSHWYIYVPTI